MLIAKRKFRRRKLNFIFPFRFDDGRAIYLENSSRTVGGGMIVGKLDWLKSSSYLSCMHALGFLECKSRKNVCELGLCSLWIGFAQHRTRVMNVVQCNAYIEVIYTVRDDGVVKWQFCWFLSRRMKFSNNSPRGKIQEIEAPLFYFISGF